MRCVSVACSWLLLRTLGSSGWGALRGGGAWEKTLGEMSRAGPTGAGRLCRENIHTHTLTLASFDTHSLSHTHVVPSHSVTHTHKQTNTHTHTHIVPSHTHTYTHCFFLIIIKRTEGLCSRAPRSAGNECSWCDLCPRELLTWTAAKEGLTERF